MRLNEDDLSKLSMLELFRVEAENHIATLTDGLLALERGEATPAHLESLMRAAHSLKGAALLVKLSTAVRVAHTMEDAFVAAQLGRAPLGRPQIDTLLRGVDLLIQISKSSSLREIPSSVALGHEPDVISRGESGLSDWEQEHADGIGQFLSEAAAILPGPVPPTAANIAAPPSEVLSLESRVQPPPRRKGALARPEGGSPQSPIQDPGLGTRDSGLGTRDSGLQTRAAEPLASVVRLNAENLNRLLGLAGESLVVSRWLRPFSDSMQRLKRMQSELEHSLDSLRSSLDAQQLRPQSVAHLAELFQKAADTREFLSERLQELDRYDRRSAHLPSQLYHEVLRTRMQPFHDGVRRFPRMVRDLAQSLGKQVRLEILGENTQVDRDILERLEAPLTHLLRNAMDHGCETSELRAAAGKPPEALIQLEARHSAGHLLVSVSDDGGGVDSKRLRKAIVEKKLTTAPLAEKMGDVELLEFLFLPGFTMKDRVTEISGRGVGLDVVQTMVKSVRGTVRCEVRGAKRQGPGARGQVLTPDTPWWSTRFQLQLPLTLSVLRALLVEVAGEPYAIPLAQITRTLKLRREHIETLEGRPHFAFGEQRIGLLTAHQVFDCAEVSGARCEVSGSSRPQPSTLNPQPFDLPVVVLGDHNSRYGLVVDRFLGERELVVQPLDARLGKVKDISAAALMEDGSPVLIVDVEDLVRSMENLTVSGALTGLRRAGGFGEAEVDSGATATQAGIQRKGFDAPVKKKKRILAVDDSLTIRELERKLLTSHGYLADVAVDGMDGWNAVRTGVYDLIITDVDMPRMDGIELATLIKKDAQLKSLPVLIVSYKDREQDRLRGLEAGADYYLTKGSFHDETLLQAVLDLIGEPGE